MCNREAAMGNVSYRSGSTLQGKGGEEVRDRIPAPADSAVKSPRDLINCKSVWFWKMG